MPRVPGRDWTSRYEPPEKKARPGAAVQYDQKQDDAPRVVASGEGYIAEKIVELARQADVPVVEDAALVSALLVLELGEEIPQSCTRPSPGYSPSSTSSTRGKTMTAEHLLTGLRGEELAARPSARSRVDDSRTERLFQGRRAGHRRARRKRTRRRGGAYSRARMDAERGRVRRAPEDPQARPHRDEIHGLAPWDGPCASMWWP